MTGPHSPSGAARIVSRVARTGELLDPPPRFAARGRAPRHFGDHVALGIEHPLPRGRPSAPSKDELFAEILRQLLARSMDGLDLAYRPDQPLRPQLLELVQQKLALLRDPHFIDLARVAIAAAIHSPERAHDMVARMGEREEGLTTWVRAAAADGRLKTDNPLFASMQLQGLLKGFAFWPQITLSQPALTPAQQAQVGEAAVDMFLACYGRPDSDV
ncbi:TetR/AcrR family transcriptional regulator C-terminal domain-containing protein [Luteimonas chenhongjianii]